MTSQRTSRGYALNRCRTCLQYYPEYHDRCPYGCVSTTVSFQTYGVNTEPFADRVKKSYDELVKEYHQDYVNNLRLQKEKNMCEKKEPSTKWSLRIGTDSKNQYSVELNKKIADEYSGYMQSHDNVLRTFETFEDALKFANDTHKNLSK